MEPAFQQGERNHHTPLRSPDAGIKRGDRICETAPLSWRGSSEVYIGTNEIEDEIREQMILRGVQGKERTECWEVLLSGSPERAIALMEGKSEVLEQGDWALLLSSSSQEVRLAAIRAHAREQQTKDVVREVPPAQTPASPRTSRWRA